MSHCPHCIDAWPNARGTSSSDCPGCGHEAELAHLSSLKKLIGYVPTMSCCRDELEHLGHLKQRSNMLTAHEAELAAMRAALAVAEEMAAQKHHGPRCYEHMSGVVIRCVCGADDIRARFHEAMQDCK